MIGQLSTIGLAFVFALVLGFGGGYWLDLRLGTKPVLSLAGFVLGLAAGVLNVVRTMRVATAPEPASPPGAPMPPPAAAPKKQPPAAHSHAVGAGPAAATASGRASGPSAGTDGGGDRSRP